MSTQVKILKERLYGKDGLGVTNFKFTPGYGKFITPEQIATEVNKALDSIESGNCTVVSE